MPSLFEMIVEYFQTMGWKFTPMPGQTILRMGFTGNNGNWICYAQVREDAEQLIFYSVLPNHATEAKRPKIAELLTRINYNLVVGNFELDYSDGEIRYKTALNLTGVEVSQALLMGIIHPNIQTTDRFLPAIGAVMFTATTPEEAFNEVRNASAVEDDRERGDSDGSSEGSDESGNSGASV